MRTGSVELAVGSIVMTFGGRCTDAGAAGVSQLEGCAERSEAGLCSAVMLSLLAASTESVPFVSSCMDTSHFTPYRRPGADAAVATRQGQGRITRNCTTLHVRCTVNVELSTAAPSMAARATLPTALGIFVALTAASGAAGSVEDHRIVSRAYDSPAVAFPAVSGSIEIALLATACTKFNTAAGHPAESKHVSATIVSASGVRAQGHTSQPMGSAQALDVAAVSPTSRLGTPGSPWPRSPSEAFAAPPVPTESVGRLATTLLIRLAAIVASRESPLFSMSLAAFARKLANACGSSSRRVEFRMSSRMLWAADCDGGMGLAAADGKLGGGGTTGEGEAGGCVGGGRVGGGCVGGGCVGGGRVGGGRVGGGRPGGVGVGWGVVGGGSVGSGEAGGGSDGGGERGPGTSRGPQSAQSSPNGHTPEPPSPPSLQLPLLDRSAVANVHVLAHSNSMPGGVLGGEGGGLSDSTICNCRIPRVPPCDCMPI